MDTSTRTQAETVQSGHLLRHMRYNRSAGGRPVDTVDSVGKGPRFEVQESPLVETCSGTMDTSTPAKIAGNTRPQHSLYTPCARLYSAILGSSPGRLRPQASSPSKVGKDGRRKDTYIIYYTVPHITTEKEKKLAGIGNSRHALPPVCLSLQS